MQSSGDIFSASSVLGDRISHVQKEANKLQRQVVPLEPMRQHCSSSDSLLCKSKYLDARVPRMVLRWHSHGQWPLRQGIA